MTRTAKYGPVSGISENVGREFACCDLFNQRALRYLMVNVQGIAALTTLCVLAASFAFTSFKFDYLQAPSLVFLSPITEPMVNVGMFSARVTTDEFGNTNRRTFHRVINANRFVATTGANMLTLVVVNPLDGFRCQSSASKIMSMPIAWNTSSRAVINSVNFDRFSTPAFAQSSSVFGNPFGNFLTDWFHINLLKVSSLASGELLEALPGHAEGNQQPSHQYTDGRFRDYLSRTVGLITGYSARVQKLHTEHDIVRSLRNQGVIVNDTQDPKIGLTEVLSPLAA